MGILNVTPDSFYDGGAHLGIDASITRARKMAEEGANIIDIGGESTGPGSEEVSVEEELRRVIPVIEKIRSTKFEISDFLISADTNKAEVAHQALKAGAAMINDVTAGRGNPEMFSVVAEAGCSYVMMHSKDSTPRTTVQDMQYDNVLKTIHQFFEERLEGAEKAGVKREQIILDPGLGHFISNNPQYSWEILEHLEFLQDFGCPILVSPSRKSFTALSKDQPPSERLEGTLKATDIALAHGASIIRTHDVRETKELLTTTPIRRHAQGGSSQ